METQFIKPGQGGAIPDGPRILIPTNNDIEIYSPEGIEENSTFQLNATGLQIIKGRKFLVVYKNCTYQVFMI